MEAGKKIGRYLQVNEAAGFKDLNLHRINVGSFFIGRSDGG
jgi:hypothetical protein